MVAKSQSPVDFPVPLLFESIESGSDFSTSKRSSVLINAMWGWENKCTHLDARKMTKIYRKSFKRGKEMPCSAVLHIVFAPIEDIIPAKMLLQNPSDFFAFQPIVRLFDTLTKKPLRIH